LELSKSTSDILLFNGNALLNTGTLDSGVQARRGVSGTSITSGVPVIQGVTEKTASSVTVQTIALTATAAQFAAIECGAVHD